MKRFLITMGIITAASWAAWYYAPTGVRERMFGFVGASHIPSRASIREALDRAILPEDPVRHRAAAARELRRVVAGLERRAAEDIRPASSVPGETGTDAAYGRDASQKIEDLIRELEGNTPNPSLPRRIAEQALDAILPAQSATDCRTP